MFSDKDGYIKLRESSRREYETRLNWEVWGERAVCRDMVKNLDLLQQSDASFSCELKFHPSMTQFSEPDWEELKIEDNWELVYNIEREILSDNIARSRLPFEEWIVRYKQD